MIPCILLAVTPAMCNLRVPCSMKINTYRRRNSSSVDVHESHKR
ncbi:MAG: hypothetical protein JWP48_3494 [Actinoallomurus sp.]|jgi:hypothetical protein|nr:hypothetical protein [Actinoallomurus sp.]